MDGGTVWNMNVASAINQCHDMGATNEEITLDLMNCVTHNMPSDLESGNSFNNWQTARSIHGFYHNMDAISGQLRAAPGVNVRWYFQQKGAASCCPNLLNFNGTDTWCLQEAGREQARIAIEQDHAQVHSAVMKWANDRSI